MRRFVALGALLTTALVALPAAASRHHASDPTACPISSLPPNAAALPWLTSDYQARFTPLQLATQVYSCEQLLNPSTALVNNVALTALRTVTGTQWQNQNMWWQTSTTAATFETDYVSLGIPPLTLEDGPNGVRYGRPNDSPTAFPNEMATAASFDPQVAFSVGAQMGSEGAAMNYQGLQIPDLNIARIPNWGRIMESFGENPSLAGLMGAAEVRGELSQEPLIDLKHLGPYGQESDRRMLNMTVAQSALYDNYLRPFAMAIGAANKTNPNGLTIMCSYGNVNGTPSCLSPDLHNGLAALGFHGLVRSDLDVHASVPALWASGVSLVKPLTLMNLGPLSSLTASNLTALRGADLQVLAATFAAGLVTPGSAAAWRTTSVVPSALHNQGLSVATANEERGAVLLKNAKAALPLTASDGPVALLASGDLSKTCGLLATGLTAAGVKTSCHVVNPLTTAPTVLVGSDATGTGSSLRTITTHVRATVTGPVLITDATPGRSTLTINGQRLQQLAGLSEYAVVHSSVITVTAGEDLATTVTFAPYAPVPIVSLRPLAPTLASVASSLSGAKTALVLANDEATEGGDRTTLTLPFAQDQIIAAAAAKMPTTVALITSGPVATPWLANVNGLIELWNSRGSATIDNVANTMVPAYVALLDGAATPQGHLPITWPVSDAQSPLGGVAGGKFFPGVAGSVNLGASPLNGNSLGFDWYRRAGWKVQFPFGYGLTYPSVTQTFASNPSCATPSATNLCLSINVRLRSPGGTGDYYAASQIYVAPPATPSGTSPTLLLGGVTGTQCLVAGLPTAACSSGTSSVAVTNLSAGQWSPTSNGYTFGSGCYTFVLADDAVSAFAQLAGSNTTGVTLHATAPFNAATSFSPGVCPAN